jgi:hypothetical protein
MRTQAIVVAVMCLALAAAVFSLAPVGGLTDGSGDDIQNDELQDQANESALGDDNFSGAAETEGEGSLIGTIISGGRAIFQIVGMIALLPNTMMSLGLPFWFAQPVGWAATIIGGVGAIQFVTGRRYQ